MIENWKRYIRSSLPLWLGASGPDDVWVSYAGPDHNGAGWETFHVSFSGAESGWAFQSARGQEDVVLGAFLTPWDENTMEVCVTDQSQLPAAYSRS